jgi:AcrR family transcriptional regulator
MAKRSYRGTVQAEVAALTRRRIIDASLALVAEHWIDQVTLDQVARDAGVTVQTMLRHFGSKDGLFAAAGRLANDMAIAQRAEAPAGDLEGAVNNLIAHYEEVGDRVVRLIAQEERYPQLHEFLEEGRVKHREWVERVFAPYLTGLVEEDRCRLLAELVTLCDVRTWRLLHKDSRLSREQTRLALLEMLSRVLGIKGERQ